MTFAAGLHRRTGSARGLAGADDAQHCLRHGDDGEWLANEGLVGAGEVLGRQD